jgi:protein-S-isoprenylcysteine O-methyltransferase Ste14
MSPITVYIFLAGTICIILFSWFVSLKEKRYHGIPRFFAFEGLLLLGLVQQPVWFDDPWTIKHIISWFLLCLCIYYVMAAVIFYFRHAAPGRNFENSTKLVTTGIYKYVRHPMYASLLFLGWGMFFKAMNPASIALIGVITAALFITCKVEEREMISRFGEEYREYMKRTKRWIPLVY